MFGKLGDMMGKLQEMKQRADEIKSKLDGVILKSEGAGGDIKIDISGNREVKNIVIAPALQMGNAAELQGQLVAAINRAIKEANKVNDEEMKKAASSLLPGL